MDTMDMTQMTLEEATQQPPDDWQMGMDDRPEKELERITLDTLDASHHPAVQGAIEACYQWASRKSSGYNDASMVLVGPTGAGKTHIARALLWSMTQVATTEDGSAIRGTERPVGRFFMANDLVQALDQETYASTLVGGAPIVVVDDVGSEQTIPYVSDEAQAREIEHRYFKLINYCFDFQVSLVITSNLSIEELKEHLGQRSWSRLQKMAPKGYIRDFTGVSDWRVKQGGREAGGQ